MVSDAKESKNIHEETMQLDIGKSVLYDII
jgi:hypothetical protein